MGRNAHLVAGIAVTLNWRNSLAGYWINLAIVTATDAGLIVTTLMPGYMKLADGLVGPVLWLAAAGFTTAGVLKARAPSAGLQLGSATRAEESVPVRS